jgi:osmoprotectant transport system ATP-binding protein
MIRFEHVTKRYPDGTVAVDDFTIDLPDGEITVFVGSSGSGKTTCLRMINRMVEPTTGVIAIDGRDVMSVPAHELRRGIGYVIQQAGLFPHRRVIDNVTVVPRLLGWDKARARSRAMELLELVGLDEKVARRYPAQLSGGQQQRVGVARALAADPPILLMDEPFGAVDPLVRQQLQRELLRLQGELRKTIAFVTHDIDEAILLGDRVAVLEQSARIAQWATPPEMLRRPASAFVAQFLGDDRALKLLSITPSVSIDVDPPPTNGTTPWRLRVDGAGRPVEWFHSVDAQTAEVVPVRAEQSARHALDIVISSPTGLAVLLDEAGDVRGVADHTLITAGWA